MKKNNLYNISIGNCLTRRFVLQYNSGAKTTEEAMTIAGLTTLETLYEKKTEEGSILLYRVPGEDQISLAFLNRDFSGYEYVDGTIQYETTSLEEQAGITYVTLRQSDDLPYTIYAVLQLILIYMKFL